jgi:hypothetical protein
VDRPDQVEPLAPVASREIIDLRPVQAHAVRRAKLVGELDTFDLEEIDSLTAEKATGALDTL